MVAQTQKTFKMKIITLTQEQQDALLKVSMDSFRESGLRQSLREQDKWWADNILNGQKPYRVDRISGTTFHVFMNPE
jgi:hypothetical protein